MGMKRVEEVEVNVLAKAERWCKENGFEAFWEYASSHSFKFTYTRASIRDLKSGAEPLVTLTIDGMDVYIYRSGGDLELRVRTMEVLRRRWKILNDRWETLGVSEHMETKVKYEQDDTLVWPDDVLAYESYAFMLASPAMLGALLVELALYVGFTNKYDTLPLIVFGGIEPEE